MVQENEEEAFYKMQDAGEKEAWFKMQIWMLQFLVRDFKESDGAIIGGVSITTPKSSRRVWFASKTTAGMQTAAMSNLLSSILFVSNYLLASPILWRLAPMSSPHRQAQVLCCISPLL